MGEPARTEVKIERFIGLATNLDPVDMPPGGAQVQVNVQGLRTGLLETRRGIRPITFDDEDA